MEKIRIHSCNDYRNHTCDYPLENEEVWLCEISKANVKHYHCRKCEERIRRIATWRKEEEKFTLKRLARERQKIYIQELPDSFVIKRIKHANNLLKDIDIDPDLIELARVSLKLKFLTERKHKSLVNCKTHGNLYRHEIIKSGMKNDGSQKYRCKLCMKRIHQQNYDKNKIKILLKQKEYRLSNPEKRKEIKDKSRRKCNAKNNKHENVAGQSITSN